MRILIVEDDELLARSLARGLRAEGYAVDLAGDGAGGLYLAQEYEYDAMILDVMLPAMNGYAVCAKLRASGRDLPVLMLTASTKPRGSTPVPTTTWSSRSSTRYCSPGCGR
jgi:DNA-binding response OmpR family regulator